MGAPVAHFEIVWEPQVNAVPQADLSDRMVQYAFLLKRAAVVVTGKSGTPSSLRVSRISAISSCV